MWGIGDCCGRFCDRLPGKSSALWGLGMKGVDDSAGAVPVRATSGEGGGLENYGRGIRCGVSLEDGTLL